VLHADISFLGNVVALNVDRNTSACVCTQSCILRVCVCVSPVPCVCVNPEPCVCVRSPVLDYSRQVTVRQTPCVATPNFKIAFLATQTNVHYRRGAIIHLTVKHMTLVDASYSFHVHDAARKGWDVLLAAYLQEFTSKVRLITCASSLSYSLFEMCCLLLRIYKSSPPRCS
jgi:hypothetical protein